jgi:signal transduction histidine kinase/ActR/RegA family two-component response regulator/HPt (histidine-containing phosphotransfer) domain-containing protein
MRMAPKILLWMLVVVALVATSLGYVCLNNVNTLGRRLSSLYSDAVVPLWCASEMNDGLDEMRIALVSALETDGSARQPHLTRAEQSRTKFEAAFDRYKSEYAITFQPEMRALLDKHGTLDEQYTREREAIQEVTSEYPLARAALVRVIELLTGGHAGDARELYFREAYPRFDRINDSVITFEKLQLEEGELANRESRVVAGSARRQLLLSVIGIAIAAAGLALWLSRVVTRPIHRLILATREIAAGKFTRTIPIDSRDEMGELGAALNRMVTALKTQQEDVRQAQRAAEAANQAKSGFLANMSHEIRTPMNAILGYSELMLKPSQTQSDRLDCIQTIRRNARHLLDVINDILDISKIEAGKMTVERIAVELPRLVAEVLSMTRPRAREKGLLFRAEFDGPVPRTIETDQLRVTQILVNLLGNAVKFTEAGEVSLRISCRQRGRTDGVIRFDVTDTGVGMTADQAARLFQPFTQADESTTRRFGGTGLGLSISAKLAELLGGTIAVSSEIGRGSTFSLTINPGPLANAEMLSNLTESHLAMAVRQEQSAVQVQLRGRILLAEDGRDNQRLIKAYLGEAGADVTVVENGRLALAAARAQQFDLILMDMQMPEMDGYTAASQLRSRGVSTPIIALTAHAMSGDREKCLRCGCTDYLTKPIDGALLCRTAARYMTGTEPAAGNVASSAPSDSAPHPASEKLYSAMADNPVVAGVLPEFIAELPGEVDRLLSLLRQNDLLELRRAAHQMRGAGGGYGYPAISEAAARAERIIDESGPGEQVRSQIESLVRLVRTVAGYDPTMERYDETHSAGD